MVKSQFGTLIPFHTHRRSHIKSETFRTLVRIFTHCYDNSHMYVNEIAVPQLVNEIAGPRNPNDLDDAIQKDVVGDERIEVIRNGVHMVNNGLENPTSTGYEGPIKDFSAKLLDTSAGCGTGVFASNHSRDPSEVQMVNNELENPMSIGYEEHIALVDDEDYLADLQSFLMEEPVIAEQELVDSGHYSFEVYKAFESCIEKDIVSEVCKNNEDENSFLEPASLKLVSLEKNVVGEVLEKDVVGEVLYDENKTSSLGLAFLEKDVKGKNGDEKTSSLELNALEEAGHVTGHKDMELINSVCTSTAAKNTPPHRSAVEEMEVGEISDESLSYNQSRAAEEIEEGEISDESWSYNQSSDLFPESCVTLDEKKVGKEQITEDVTNRKVIHKEQNEPNKKDISSSYDVGIVNNGGNCIEVKVSNRNLMESKSKAVCIVKDKKADNSFPESGRTKNQVHRAKEGVNLFRACPDGIISHEEISEENTIENQGITSPQKDAAVCKKRKRGGRKENKKKKQRMKRAENDRMLGVKRLKLQPVLRPQVKRICQHFLKGRCRQGAECNFSHDTVPLTKSTPCVYFARKQCMKGDACPFDHELSKYPCHNYVSTGYCNRSDECLFSHKVIPNGNSPATPAVCKPPNSTSLSLPGNSDSQNSKQNIAEIMLKPPAQPPKGISFYSPGKSKSPSDVSTKVKQAHSSPKGGHLNVVNQTNQNASNETPKKTPHVSQGKNLLLFGESSKKQALSLNMNKVIGKYSESAGTSPLPGPSSLGINSLLQNASAIARNFPVSLPSGGQSSGQLSDGHKNTPSSSQKLLLTSSLKKVLAFAGKYESNMKMDRSVAGTSGTSQFDSSKTLSLFDSLYGGGS